MDGGCISNYRVSAVLSGISGAYGIAGTIKSQAEIVSCYSACSLSAIGSDAAVCGIAEGIEGSIGAVSVGSHFSGAHAARISLRGSENCIAYDSMTCTGIFLSTG